MKKQTAGREYLGRIAPQFAELNDDVLFGKVWAREKELSLRDRSMITIASLLTAGQYPQLKSHLALGKEHGIQKDAACILLRLAESMECLPSNRRDLWRGTCDFGRKNRHRGT